MTEPSCPASSPLRGKTGTTWPRASISKDSLRLEAPKAHRSPQALVKTSPFLAILTLYCTRSKCTFLVFLDKNREMISAVNFRSIFLWGGLLEVPMFTTVERRPLQEAGAVLWASRLLWHEILPARPPVTKRVMLQLQGVGGARPSHASHGCQLPAM